MKLSMELQGWQFLDEAFRRAPDLVRKELLAAVTEADMLLEREVKDATPTATGVSRASIFSREQALPDGAIGVVGTSQTHMAYVELGTQPHFPPVQALEDWVRVKLGISDPKKVHGIAYLIARKIARRGTKGKEMFKLTWDRYQPQVEAIFSRATARIAAGLAGGAPA